MRKEKKIEEMEDVIKNTEMTLLGIKDALNISDEIHNFSKLSDKDKLTYENAFINSFITLYIPYNIKLDGTMTTQQIKNLSDEEKKFYSIWTTLIALMYVGSPQRLNKKSMESLIAQAKPGFDFEVREDIYNLAKAKIETLKRQGINEKKIDTRNEYYIEKVMRNALNMAQKGRSK